jgi:hypothetical protein
MRPLSIPAGTAVLLGRPAQPMAVALSDSIAQMVRSIPGIREAYLPQCFVKGVVEPPAQVLVLVLDTTDQQRVLDSVGEGLTRALPQGVHLDVWPMSDRDSLLGTVRGTRMHVHCDPPPERKPWWRIFG